jgi:hypothetical protein
MAGGNALRYGLNQLLDHGRNLPRCSLKWEQTLGPGHVLPYAELSIDATPGTKLIFLRSQIVPRVRERLGRTTVLRPLARFFSTLLLCAIGSACTFAQGQALPAQIRLDETRLVKLSGTLHPLARPENDRGAVSDSFPADRLIVLVNPPADRKHALEQFLREAHAPGSPAYHKWISPEEFGTRFGARDEDVQQVQSWLQSHGFSVARLSKSRHFLEFSGTAAQVREALHAEIHQYEVEGNFYYSISTDVSIPDTLAPLIHGFAPLNTFPLTSYVHTAGRGTLSPKTGRVQPEFTTTAGGSTFYALSPEDFATQYNIGPQYQAGTNGTGTTIGIVGTSNLNLSMVDAFRKLYGLPGDNTQVVIDGEDPGVGLAPNVEGFLDVELSGAVAPKATVNYYIAGGNHFQSSLVLATMRAIEDNQADILSLSYGECEQLLGPVGNQLWSTMWEEAAAQGQTVLVASGDSGPATCGFGLISSGGLLTPIGLSVNGLASTPWNVAVGGTDFFYSDYASGGTSITSLWNPTNDANFGSLKAPLPEQPWDNPLGLNIKPLLTHPLVIPGGAGGGGPSVCSQFTPSGTTFVCAGGYPKPAWQNAPGVPTDGVRDLPDVSLFAASGKNLSAYAICAEPGDCAPVTTGDPQVLLVGGTSASTPAMAGVMALVNQRFGRQGQANFTLYALARQQQQPSVFHDITIGTNDVLCFNSTPGCTTPVPVPNLPLSIASYGVYAAGPGYDLATGLGSLDVDALIGNWNKITFLPTSTTLQITPSSIMHGTAVNITTTVTANTASAVPPSGEVNIKTTAPVPLRVDFVPLAGGTGSTNWNYFPGGTYQVTAQYFGDGTFKASTSPASTLTVTPEASTTALTLQYENLDPVARPIIQTGTVPNGGQAPFSSIWTFQAQPSGLVPQIFSDATGTATFTDGSTSVTVPLNSQGVAAWSPRVLAIGAHSVTVNYSGDASYNPSTAGPLTFTVTKGTPEFAAVLEARPVSFGLNSPPTYLAGSTAIIHVLLRALNSFVPPSGNVTVSFGSLTQTAALTADTFSNQGLAAVNFTFANVAPGAYQLSATYVGDANWNASAFFGATYNFATATASATTTSLSLTPSSVDSSGAVKFTVTVAAPQGTTLSPTGIASLVANGTIFSSVGLIPSPVPNTPVSTGTATVPATAIPSGALQVMAVYSGSLGFAPSSSTMVPLTVTFTDFTMSAGVSRVLVKSGQSATVPLLLSGPNGGSTTVSLACLPSSASFGCTVSPLTQTVTGATSASLTINAFIPGTTSTARLETIGARRGLLAASAGFVFAFFLVFTLPRRELRRALLLSFAFLAIGTFAAGCGSSSSPPPPPPPPPNLNAPPGTYTVVVTAISGGITHNVRVTVIIQ